MYKQQKLEPCREGLGTRLTKGLIGRPLLQTPTTGALQGSPWDEANQRPHWKTITTNTTASCKPMLDTTGVSGSKSTFKVGG